VAKVTHSAEIEVRAPAEAAFAVLAEDIVAVEDDSVEMTTHWPIDQGSLRVGLCWQQITVHERAVRRTGWVVTELREPYVLEQAMAGLCGAARQEVIGGERWELEETSDGTTIVTLRSWRERPGLGGWLESLFASPDDATGVALRKRLAAVQLRAERGSSHTVR
jgi:hypothetical protein